ncbi:DUF2585 family protein [Cereibacter sp. SYSU M97828]|nr:DUF2585 family protein [Cereibacter flavus]
MSGQKLDKTMPPARQQRPPSRFVSPTFAAFACIAAQTLFLLIGGDGRGDECAGFWQQGFDVACNSQHPADAYIWLHLGFGAALAVLFSTIRPFWPRPDILFLVIFCAAVWEMVENTSFVIGLFSYDEAMGYSGDSLRNSLMDTAAAAVGALGAFALPRRLALSLVVMIELSVTLAIGDGYVIGLLRTTGIF